MTKDGLHFPNKIQNLKKAASFEELKVSTGEPRYFVDDKGFWGFHLGDCGLTQEDWDWVQNNNRIQKLKVLHLGNQPDSKSPNTLRHLGLGFKPALVFADVSHNPNLESIQCKEDATGVGIHKIIASECPVLKLIILKGDFSNLTHIESERSGLTEVVLEGRFPKLRFLELSHNQLESLTIPSSCSKLEYLFAQNNQLKTIEFEGEVLDLNILDVSENHIELLPPRFHKLNKIEEVNLSNNEIKDITQFRIYIFRGFPLYWEREYGGFVLEGNPLEEAIVAILNLEDITEKKARLLETIRLLEKGRNPEIRRAKLILLGNTGVGKTTLSDIFTKEDKVKEGSTHGVNLFRYKIGNQEVPVEVQGFDFGGQDYYHSTHFAFFGYNAFYVLLWGNKQPDALSLNDDHDRRFPLNYWLGSARYYDKRLGNDSENSPNRKSDIELHLLQNLPEDAVEVEELDNRTLKKRYDFIRSIQAFCLKKEKKGLEKWLNQQLDEYAKPIIISKIESEIAQAIRTQPKVILTFEELQHLHSETRANTPEQTLRLVQNLHDRFECFYHEVDSIDKEAARQKEGLGGKSLAVFEKDNEILKELLTKSVIAHLDKFTGWIYAILSKEIQGDGYFTQDQAKDRLEEKGEEDIKKLETKKNTAETISKLRDEYTEAQTRIEFILAFMQFHKIIFRVNHSDETKFIAPHYLNPIPKVSEQLFLDSFESPLVKYHFREFFHVNLITEVMLRYYECLLQEGKEGSWNYVMWKNKVILYEENAQENKGIDKKKLLLIDFEEEEDENTKEKIASIRLHRFIKNAVSDAFVKEVMTFIESQIKNYEYQKRIITPFGDYMPVECLEQQNTDIEGKNKGLVYHDNRIYRKADFKLFLENPDDYPLKRLFISYSSKQSDFMRRFEVHLAPLKQNGLVDVWHDRMITNGTLWDEKIQKELEASDIVVFLLSPDFLNTPYVMNEEVPKAIEMGKQPFFVQLMDCGWQRMEMLSKYQMSSDHKWVQKNILNLKNNPNDGETWEKIITDLEETINSLTPKSNALTN